MSQLNINYSPLVLSRYNDNINVIEIESVLCIIYGFSLAVFPASNGIKEIEVNHALLDEDFTRFS